jgi:hypothetical protein
VDNVFKNTLKKLNKDPKQFSEFSKYYHKKYAQQKSSQNTSQDQMAARISLVLDLTEQFYEKHKRKATRSDIIETLEKEITSNKEQYGTPPKDTAKMLQSIIRKLKKTQESWDQFQKHYEFREQVKITTPQQKQNRQALLLRLARTYHERTGKQATRTDIFEDYKKEIKADSTKYGFISEKGANQNFHYVVKTLEKDQVFQSYYDQHPASKNEESESRKQLFFTLADQYMKKNKGQKPKVQDLLKGFETTIKAKPEKYGSVKNIKKTLYRTIDSIKGKNPERLNTLYQSPGRH